MKLLKTEQKLTLIKASTRRHLTALKRKNKKYFLDKKPNQEKSFLGYKSIPAPEKLCIYGGDEQSADALTRTLRFIQDIKKYIPFQPCSIDFSETKQVTGAALIATYAALEIASEKSRYNNTRQSIIRLPSSSDTVRSTLCRLNFPKVIKSRISKYTPKSYKHLPIVSSTKKDYMEDILDYIRDKIYDGKLNPETEHVFGDAVSETINNVNRHAYPDSNNTNQERRWWLLCQVQGKQLYLAIYDNGVGIPKTVLRRTWVVDALKTSYPEVYQELIEKKPELISSGLLPTIRKDLKDSQLIHLSLQADVTGTKEKKHGQGSKSIRALVSETEGGKLWIFSNNGLYKFYDTKHFELFHLPKKLEGTLFQWNIEIK
ncbi:hypothetical protein DT594_02930 [Halopseudomonas laoshanensis]|uniref:Uncharacterized protein n=1 Tax=Halopseudomonas laoshanensis TaxID=2268758 RepID=A0A7V7KX58_9GAMM|nr:hypothetical protein [Halopseudomonas laoshanensis]KAA0696328.1 hypothetical protein DT594_02930 [Halopseudomonas laoshanensis]